MKIKIVMFCLAAFLAVLGASATPLPHNLVNGLDKMVENNLIELGILPAPPPAQRAAIAQAAARYASRAIVHTPTGRYLVEIMPNGRVPVQTLRSSLQATFPLFTPTATNATYVGHGVIEGHVALSDVPAIASVNGVGSVILQLRPILSVGAVTEAGVNQHRVNRVNTLYNPTAPLNYDGTGIQIGVMSDSYNGHGPKGSATTPEMDVATGDLPGSGNSVNSQPVVVLQDFVDPTAATDEGRAMCQIVHDMSPKSRIGFATAFVGELGFANNIRALAGLPGYTYPSNVQQGFKADVVCDDVSYIDEPMFQDGIVAQGVIDVVNAGVSYCSSAANNWGTDGYASVFRPVPNGSGLTPATNSALANTNINLSGVPPALYAGGFHNFNESGLDVAQTINTGNDAGAFIFQWNDPYDSSAPALIEPPIFEGDGNSQAGAVVDFGPFAFEQAHAYVITEMATGTPPLDNFDAIVAIIDQSGNTLVDQDTGVDEVVTFFAPASGNYTVRVHPYAASPPVYTHGPFHIKINAAMTVSGITQDFNCLFFDMSGNFISALDANAFITNRPYELSIPSFNNDGYTQVQLVISRSNTAGGATAANQLKYVWFGNGLSGVGPAEYGSYLTPVTFGHSAAAGANSVAAYDVFRPNIPEDFTSSGPVVIYFDVNNNRLPTPQVRLKPDIAAADGSNNTFFPIGPVPIVIDSQYDLDAYPNFYGTSAASPHAAALAALVLQAHGGPGSLTPEQVKTLFQLTAFPHDLDPYEVNGSATAGNGATISINAVSDNSRNTGTGSNNANTFSIVFNGSGRLASLSFNPEGTPETGGNPTGGNFNGNPTGNLVADFLDPTKYSYTPGMVWTSTFAFGNSVGLVAGDVAATRSNPAPFPANPSPGNPTQHMWTLNLGFTNNNFTSGKILRFNNGRSQWQDATVPQGQTVAVFVRQDYSADMLGSGVLIPEFADNPTVKPGMTFSGTVVDGETSYPFSGRLENRIGRGYSVLDGYGFINAEAATTATLPAPGVVSRKTHGAIDTFDVPLPTGGPAGIECRVPGANSSHTLIFTFDRAIAAPGNSTVTDNPTVSTTASLGPQPNQVTVQLSNVPNAQTITVTLNGMIDSSGNSVAPVTVPMSVLLGDSTANGTVNASDVSQIKSQTGSVVTAANFRSDVTADGNISASDIALVKSRLGTGLAQAGSATVRSKR